MSIQLTMQGFEEVLEVLDLDVEGQLGSVIDQLLGEGTKVARIATPVDTGAMRGAWQWARSGLEGMMDIDPSAVNPRSGTPVTEYAPSVDARLGIVDATFQRISTMELTEVGFDGH